MPDPERAAGKGRPAINCKAFEAACEVAMKKELTAVIERDGDGYVALCPEVDVASQGDTIADARENLCEALELFFETAPEDEIARRMRSEVYVTRVEVAVG